MRVVRVAVALNAVFFAAAGCGVFSSRSPTPATTELAVEVENHNWSDIVIYLMNGNQSQRLGMVTSLSTAHLVFPYRNLGNGGNVRLRAYPIGGSGAFTSENLLVQPGQSIKWTLEADLSRSSLAVY